MAKPATTTGGRTVIKNDYEATYRAAREKAKTPRYQEVRRQHPKVEESAGGNWPAGTRCGMPAIGERPRYWFKQC